MAKDEAIFELKALCEGETNVEIPQSLKIDCPKDCGKAPKKVLLKELTVALATGDYIGMSENLADDIRWQIAGHKSFFGKEDLKEALNKNTSKEMIQLHIQNIITHGSTGAVNGFFVFDDHSTLSFCDVYTFSSAGKSAKVKEIMSFRVEEKLMY
ncbi:nuclear transport factor 2 family protein [Mesobacillus sp. LC4]